MDPEEIKKTQNLLGKFLVSPSLSQKLLQKPPLRFLHDIFVSIVSDHHLMLGLFDADELAWNESVANDKDAKAFFIAKMINYVSLASGTNVGARSAKICSGQEADKTNQLLQQLAMILQQKPDSTFNDAIIRRVKSREGPETLTTYAKSSLFLTVDTGSPDVKKSQASKPASDVASSSQAKLVEPAAVTKLPSKSSGPAASKIPTAINSKESSRSITAVVKKNTIESSRTTKPGAAVVVKPPVNSNDISSKARKNDDHESMARTEDMTTSSTSNAATAVRPTTARRAPQRPPTATITSGAGAAAPVGGLVRRDTFVLDSEKLAQEAMHHDQPNEGPPPDVKFLADDDDDDQGAIELTELENDLNFSRDPVELQLYSGHGDDSLGTAGQLVSHLRQTQKALVESHGIADNEPANNVLVEQESVRFQRDVDELRTILQRVSRLTDILTTQMHILPEDLQDMDKDRQRYMDDIKQLHQDIEEANKLEEGEMEKLRREQSLQEEALFVINEDIASTQYRIKEKRLLHEKLLRLASTQW